DLRLRILTTSFLQVAHMARGEYARVVQLAADNLAVLPPDWLYENLGTPGLTSVYVRGVLVVSLVDERARLVIGADGRNSKLARIVGATSYEAARRSLAGISPFGVASSSDSSRLGGAGAPPSSAFRRPTTSTRSS